MDGARGIYSVPPISQMTRNGWGTAAKWMGHGGEIDRAQRRNGRGTGNLLCPTHSAKNAKWTGHTRLGSGFGGDFRIDGGAELLLIPLWKEAAEIVDGVVGDSHLTQVITPDVGLDGATGEWFAGDLGDLAD